MARSKRDPRYRYREDLQRRETLIEQLAKLPREEQEALMRKEGFTGMAAFALMKRVHYKQEQEREDCI